MVCVIYFAITDEVANLQGELKAKTGELETIKTLHTKAQKEANENEIKVRSTYPHPFPFCNIYLKTNLIAYHHRSKVVFKDLNAYNSLHLKSPLPAPSTLSSQQRSR